MQPIRIRQVKKEIRVLGVAAAGHDGSTRVVGVVFRGARWLDGVLYATSKDADLTRTIVEMINGSPHRKQVRVMMFQAEMIPKGVKIDTIKISSETSKPVIILGAKGLGGAQADPNTGYFTWGKGADAVEVAYLGLRERDVEAVLRVSTREGSTPEALKVAGLILGALP
ncbi:DUF99 family protein [Candidatus Bathyarchaeota archaeon]|nr:DUF99 family protein [Candidatus Bathyarchaeota archaeon]